MAFVLAGGGSLGAVQVGMLLALTEAGIRPDLIIGASVGAINAAHFAALPTMEGLHRLADIWSTIRRRDVFPLSPIRGTLGALNLRSSLLRSTALEALLLRVIPCREFAELNIPCHVIATDLVSGGEVQLSSGSLVQALLASSAIPAVFPPVLLGGRQLVDGAIASHAPVTSAAALGAKQIVILPTGFTCAPASLPTGAIALALHAVSLMTARLLHRDLAQFRGPSPQLLVVPPLCPLGVPSHDFSRGRELIDRAALSTREWLASGGLDRFELPVALLPHSH